jgi:hypothetical protein
MRARNQPAAETSQADVLRVCDCNTRSLRELLARFGLRLIIVEPDTAIPGSFWGDDEAGLILDALYARFDTPLHSVLHEACHWVTCTPARRSTLHTDAADNQMEENATCYLQILLADALPGFGMARALADMDAWGYSFRLGSAKAWFERDALSERDWLVKYQLIEEAGQIRFQVRNSA